ncbi:MAG: hypothetical protein HN390_01270 [Anaerolineae bacterium]|jgi:hypothetical protein|nr:hypothetical protein [Anaerolineae bacterium]MBT7191569.1 hypothetical protein [Anaerolineae bacterium]MBT7989288.1 hypothetical protein [Anaerolineae bacterium]
MSDTTLLIGFISFAVFLLIGVMILRSISVKDVLQEEKTSLMVQASSPFQTQQNTQNGAMQEKKTFKLDRKTLNNIGKVCGTVGAIMLFAPLPESYNGFALGLAAIGYLLVKATAPPKGKKNTKTENPVAQKIRLLSSKPEYKEALKLLYNDHSDNAQATEEEKYSRAIRYLQSKGVPRDEAKENLVLLYTLLKRKKN